MTTARPTEMRRLDELTPHPKQSEFFQDVSDIEIKKLADDMNSNGQLQPVEITSSVVIICGHQRVALRGGFGWTEIEFVVRDDLEGEGEAAIERRLVEDNLNRRQLDPLEVARCYRRLKELERSWRGKGLSAKQAGDLRDTLSDRFGMSGRNLDRYLSVLRTPLAVQHAFSAGKIPLTRACKVAELPPRKKDEIAKRIEAGEEPRAVVQKFVASGDGRHKHHNDALNAFVKSLGKGLADLEGRVERINGKLWRDELPTLKQARLVITKLIARIEGKKRCRRKSRPGKRNKKTT